MTCPVLRNRTGAPDVSGSLSGSLVPVSGMSVDRVRFSVRSEYRTHGGDKGPLCPVLLGPVCSLRGAEV